MGTDQITLDEYAMTTIRAKAAQLIGRYGFTKSDRKDIEQDLVLELLVKLRGFDPGRARKSTFISMLVNCAVANLIRRRLAARRGAGAGRRSIDEIIAVDGATLAELIESGIDFVANVDAKLDLLDVLEALPPKLRRIADLLREDGISDVARKTGRTREAIRHAVRAMREHFAARGVRADDASNHSGRTVRK